MSEDSDYGVDSPQTSLDCMRGYQYITENPNWMQNVLFVAVCNLIPFIGPILVTGYQFEVADSLLHPKNRRNYVDFTFDRFQPYLLRGLWPFLATLIASMVMSAVMVPVFFLGFFVMAMIGAAAGNDAGGVVALLGIVMVFLLIMLLSLGTVIVMTPLSLRAGYSQDLATAFDFGFIKDFVRRMWKETLIVTLFLMVSSIPLMLAGLLLCGIGIYFAAAILLMAQAHLYDYQLYAIYLSRGGMPIPRKVEATQEDDEDENDDE